MRDLLQFSGGFRINLALCKQKTGFVGIPTLCLHGKQWLPQNTRLLAAELFWVKNFDGVICLEADLYFSGLICLHSGMELFNSDLRLENLWKLYFVSPHYLNWKFLLYIHPILQLVFVGFFGTTRRILGEFM